MSNKVNDQLFERAVDMIDLFEGKMPAKLIELAIERNDLEQLQIYVADAEGMASMEEFRNYDVY